ncbi:MAG: hypothetical protein IKZ51_00345 [Bacteroidales bacterium]|nr:hypothetical protein [Bacteroidales bacterium]
MGLIDKQFKKLRYASPDICDCCDSLRYSILAGSGEIDNVEEDPWSDLVSAENYG